MTVRCGVIEGSRITFPLGGYMSRGSVPLLDLIIRGSRRLGLSVTLDLEQVTDVDPEVVEQLLSWRAAGVTLSAVPEFVRQHSSTVPSKSWRLLRRRSRGAKPSAAASADAASGTCPGAPEAFAQLRGHGQEIRPLL
jgi:hypothetical protein